MRFDVGFNEIHFYTIITSATKAYISDHTKGKELAGICKQLLQRL